MRLVTLVATAAIMAACSVMPVHAASVRLAKPIGDEAAILKALQNSCDGFKAFDLEKATALYASNVHIFDMSPPQTKNYADLKDGLRQMSAAIAAPPMCGYRDMHIKVFGNTAYAYYIMPFHAQLKDGRTFDFEGRGTNIFERSSGKWLVIHEHLSLPVDMNTGVAEMKPPSSP